jgi:exodeoxyribonuclease V alpha subunit
MERLQGIVERVTFHNEETGYCVLKVSVPQRSDHVTVTGKVPSIHAGERLMASGEWILVPQWGRQFKASEIQTQPPQAVDAIEKFLGSGLIEGIGPIYAKRLVERFGPKVLDVIDQESKKLEEVEGIGAKRRREIKESWSKHKALREIMVYLYEGGLGTAKALKVYETYGADAITQLQQNPYQLVQDIYGIGFKTADAMAQKSGLAATDPRRARAGILHTMQRAADEGHTAPLAKEISEKCMALLGLASENVEEALRHLKASGDLVCAGEQVSLPHLAKAEESIAQNLRGLREAPSSLPKIDISPALAWLEASDGLKLAPEQLRAVERALKEKVLIITGGPGVGKTTILRSILKLLRKMGISCVLAAPTGRAARRMSETTGLEATTIHRLLEYQAGKGFTRNLSRALEGQYFVLDECSMVDVVLAAAWLSAVPQGAHILLVGDADQLPSVGQGNVLRDLIDSGKVPCVRLTEIFRQAATSAIITAAHAVNRGAVPPPSAKDADFHFIARGQPEEILATMRHLVRERVPKAFGLDPLKDVQILSPMNRGPLGTLALNAYFQKVLNPPDELVPEVERFQQIFRRGDKVIQVRNNYEKEAFNGDIGTVVEISGDPVTVEVRFDSQRLVSYATGELDELRLAYAITIHKSQGSEFPVVIMPVSTQHFMMLQRNLLYTGITRGKRLVLLVGTPEALEIAVQRQEGLQRHTRLHALMISGSPSS